MDCRSCCETSKQAHTFMQDSERRHAGSSNDFYLQTVLAITMLPFGNYDKTAKKFQRTLQTYSIRNSNLFQLLASGESEMTFSFKLISWEAPVQFEFGYFLLVSAIRMQIVSSHPGKHSTHFMWVPVICCYLAASSTAFVFFFFFIRQSCIKVSALWSFCIVKTINNALHYGKL